MDTNAIWMQKLYGYGYDMFIDMIIVRDSYEYRCDMVVDAIWVRMTV